MALQYPNRQHKPILISISLQHAQFLKETGLKPSSLLRQTINELMESYNPTDIKTLLLSQRAKMKQLTETIIKQRDLLERNGLLEEYIK